MWKSRVTEFYRASLEKTPTTAYVDMAADAAKVDAFAQLCGNDTRPFARRFEKFLSEADVAGYDVIWESYRLQKERLVGQYLRVSFPKGECWQRGEDLKAFQDTMVSGRIPEYDGLEPWQ